MPFPKTWAEELIIEWLHLDGFLVEANLPVSVAKRGGRLEVDIVGARISGNMLEIKHIETGQLSGGQEGANRVKEKKFSNNVCSSVINYFKQRLSFTGNRINYQKVFIPTHWSNPTIKTLTQLGITVKPLPDFICHEILPTIQKWKQNPPHQPQTKGKYVTLPESYWLLQLIDYLNDRRLLKGC